MTEPKEPSWQYSVVRIGAAIQTVLAAGAATLVVFGFNRGLGYGALFLIFGGFFFGFYFLWIWVFITHPAELKKKLPISSKELRRRRKEFYENLPK